MTHATGMGIYFYIAFVYGIWHPTWIIFLVIPLAKYGWDLFVNE